MPSTNVCQFPGPGPGTPATASTEHDLLSPVDAPAEVCAPDSMTMPCVVGVLSDIAMRIWCTRAVAAELARDRGFVTAAGFPELTVRSYLPLCKRTITTSALCDVTSIRVADDGGFVLDVRVRRIDVDSSEAVRRFRRERGRSDAGRAGTR